MALAAKGASVAGRMLGGHNSRVLPTQASKTFSAASVQPQSGHNSTGHLRSTEVDAYVSNSASLEVFAVLIISACHEGMIDAFNSTRENNLKAVASITDVEAATVRMLYVVVICNATSADLTLPRHSASKLSWVLGTLGGYIVIYPVGA